MNCNNNGETNNSSPNDTIDQLQAGRDNKIIAKPLPSRPGPPPSFLAAAAAHHGLNHPHLHTLLAHCRNPYMGGEFFFLIFQKDSKFNPSLIK